MATAVQKITLSSSRDIPFNKLVLSQSNVRRVKAGVSIEELAEEAKRRLRLHGCGNVEVRLGNGYHGWSEHAPFDKVIVTAAADLVPPPLIHQLKNGGKMVVPAGLPEAQELVRQGDDEGDFAGAVLTTRGDRTGLTLQTVEPCSSKCGRRPAAGAA